MPNIYEEHTLLLRKIVKEYKCLQRLNKGYRLLKLAKNVNDDGFTRTDEFSAIYDKDDGTNGVVHLINISSIYYLDLRAAVTRESKKLLYQKRKSKKQIWEKLKKDRFGKNS